MRSCLIPFLVAFFLQHSVSLAVIDESLQPERHICECNALLQFSNSFVVTKDASINVCDENASIISHPKTASWNISTDCCSWDGVTCHEEGNYVLGLDLSCSWLRGTIHSKSSLFSLSSLQWLDLTGNDFFGARIPPRFGNFTELKHLNLSYSGFYGIIPVEISQLSNLISLDLSDIYGHFLGNLVIEDHSFKWLVGNLTQLREIRLDFTDMSQVSPISMANLSTTITSLSFLGCNYTGHISSILGTLSNLTYLDLRYNNITDTLDFEMFAPLKDLEYIDLSGNNINVLLQRDGNCSFPRLRVLGLSRCNLTIFPYFLRSTRVMYSLDLSGNLITEQIPEWVGEVGWEDTLLSLYLSSNNVTGNIPSSVCKLTSLKIFYLSNNRLDGAMPTCLGNLINLMWLDLSQNLLPGPLPQSLANCKKLEELKISFNEIYDTFPHWLNEIESLETLDLQSNKFHGSIDVPIFQPFIAVILSDNNFSGHLPADFLVNSGIFSINLDNNNFEGPMPIPPPGVNFYSIANNMFSGDIPYQLCTASALELIDVSNNSLTGSIPHCFMNLTLSLLVLNLQANKLVGQIPEMFIQNTTLRTVRLSENRLRGTLPRSLAYCQALEVLDLSENELEGSFPHWLETLSNLQVLVLRSNKFSSSVDSSDKTSQPFLKLRILDLSNNGFYGPLPDKYISKLKAMQVVEKSSLQYMGAEYYRESVVIQVKGVMVELVRILTVFTTLDLSNNFFQGEIPKVIGQLKALKGLNFSHNNLTGSIPWSMSNLTELEWLDLSSNKLNGNIPRALADLTALGYLNLSNNQLVGLIPQSTQFSTFEHSFDGNPGLCGRPLTRACGSDDRHAVSPASYVEYETELSNGIEWRAILAGYACGVSIGISTCYMMLETRKPQWLMRMVERNQLWVSNILKRKAPPARYLSLPDSLT